MEEFIFKEVTFTKRKGYVQIFGDHEANILIEEWGKDCIFLFLNHLRKKKKIKFKKGEMEKIFNNFICR